MWRVAFQILPVIAWCVAFLAVVKPLSLTRRTAGIVSLVLAAALGKFTFFAVAGGDGFNPDLPAWLIWFCGWAYAAAIMLTGFAVVCAAADGVMRLCRHPVSLRTKRIRTVFLAASACAISLWGTYAGVCIPSVNRIEVAYRDLPPEFDGYRIVHLSDLHCSTAARRERFERIVDCVNGLEPDLVAITGDFVDGMVRDRKGDLAPIAGIRAKDGVYGCTGNHEAYWELHAWRKALDEFGIVFPEDVGARVVRRGGASIAIGGMPDPVLDDFESVKFAGGASGCFAGVPRDAFRIFLFHRPFTGAAGSGAADVKLQLSGHTHGGAVPILRILVAAVNEWHVRGLYEFEPGRFLHVSPGTGQWAGFPLRLLNPAEITEIVLRRK